jgi:plasmid stabilization system protein ParE
VGNYVIYYREMKTGIEIVRVIHGARDAAKAFE